MNLSLPTLHPESLDQRVLRIATEGLLELQCTGSGPTRLELELDASLAALHDSLGAWQTCALLLRNVVERLLLLDRSLDRDLDEYRDADVLEAQRAEPANRGMDLLRLLCLRGEREQPASPRWSHVLDLVGRQPSPRTTAWERLLHTPGLGVDEERSSCLSQLAAALDLDPKVVERVAPSAAALSPSSAPSSAASTGHRSPDAAWRGGLSAGSGSRPAASRRGSSKRPFAGRSPLRAQVRRSALLRATEGIQIEDQLRIHVPRRDDAARTRPLVVRQIGDSQEVVLPESPDRWAALDEYRTDHGGYELLLNVMEPTGTHHYYVALPEDDFMLDWTAKPSERSEQVMAAIQHDAFPWLDFDVQVRDRGDLGPSGSVLLPAPVPVHLQINVDDAGDWQLRLSNCEDRAVRATAPRSFAEPLHREVRSLQDALAVDAQLGRPSAQRYREAELEIGQALGRLLELNPRIVQRLERYRGPLSRRRPLMLLVDSLDPAVMELPWELVALPQDDCTLEEMGCVVTRSVDPAPERARGAVLNLVPMACCPEPDLVEADRRIDDLAYLQSRHGLPTPRRLSNLRQGLPGVEDGALPLLHLLVPGPGALSRLTADLRAATRPLESIVFIEVGDEACFFRATMVQLVDTLLRLGAHAVVAVGRGPSNPVARHTLYGALYGALARGLCLASAMGEAREELRASGRPEFAARWHGYRLHLADASLGRRVIRLPMRAEVEAGRTVGDA